MIPGLGLLRRAVTLALCGAAFWAGMQAERLLFANRVIDLCMDDTSGYFRQNGRFHPDCEGIVDAFHE
jgi:hypothetical protein